MKKAANTSLRSSYYRENLGLAGEFGDRAALGLIRAGIALKDSPLLLEVLPRLSGLESRCRSEPNCSEVARYQIEERNYAIAIQALKQYVDRYPDGKASMKCTTAWRASTRWIPRTGTSSQPGTTTACSTIHSRKVAIHSGRRSGSTI